jgi:chaperonin GroES
MKNALDKVIVVGDKVLIKPKSPDKVTKAGLYLPPGVQEKENVQTGYIIKTGPGYPIPVPKDYDEAWKKKEQEYFSLQCREGDMAVYLQKDSFEIELENEKYYIVPQHAILLLFREEE